jgi:uncharacterized membrane protein
MIERAAEITGADIWIASSPLIPIYVAGALSSVTRVTPNIVVAVLLMAPMAAFTALSQRMREAQASTGDAAALIQRCSDNEVAALESPAQFRYRERLEWNWGSETREVIETDEGSADRIIAFNDEPLAGDQIDKENRRLTKLLNEAKAMRHELEEQGAETRRRIRMMQAFASAFIFEPQGEEHGLLRFVFHPDKAFSPPDRETQVFRAMQGTVWVEPRQQRLVRIDGVLTRDVPFGWGIFGRLYKGGRYFLEQTQVEPGVWRLTRLELNLKMRSFFDTSRLLRREHNSGFKATAEGMTYREAVQQLLAKTAKPDR